MLAILDLTSLKEVGGDIILKSIPPYFGKAIKEGQSALDKLVIRIEDNGFEALVLPNLERVGGSLKVQHSEGITNISLPKLASVSQELTVVSSKRVQAILCPSLSEVGERITLSRNEKLGIVDFSSLAKAGDVEFSDNNSLTNEPVKLKMAPAMKGRFQ